MAGYDVFGVVWQMKVWQMKIGTMIDYPRDRTAIGFEARPQISHAHFLQCSHHVANAAKLHCPKGDRINESRC